MTGTVLFINTYVHAYIHAYQDMYMYTQDKHSGFYKLKGSVVLWMR
jgi:hypothetical protein